ncbi:metalloproteinase, putative [Trichophyton verrucosum HKI 0517]|uniref:Neutral protease 2 homolog TRV_03208 n=1 Tax=Trichophyton verrucosum (strain HKI 0517) TaxID=663202 RepID=NPIIF_TRIVH|nr:metalloproteinase, putative [Trichophyton verrucosum HKI 0517]D4D7X4.1 RecName: Full=Neutral protease 2 homolog TRV_03208; AltName: Full=Deuterolysin TRV_03208; Flags: Precursor [Trichophyton verrucosum HKI 0517]EFE42069.1 metalloproteinase, putative [Trichophyton verrucosum HKI 0517]
MKFFTALAAVGALLAPALALPTPASEEASHNQTLSVRLVPAGHTMVRAIVTNNGERPLHLLSFNTILDEDPTSKVEVFHESGDEAEFLGMLPRYDLSDLTEDLFTRLAPKDSVEHLFDIATVHDLKWDGKYTLAARGAIPVAEDGGTTIIDHVYYESNELDMEIDARKAAMVPRAFDDYFSKSLDKRRPLDICNPRKERDLRAALEGAQQVAKEAAAAAQNNTEKVFEFFRARDPGTRKEVSQHLSSISRAATKDGSSVTWFCSDGPGRCGPRTIAYTFPAKNEVHPCPLFWQMPHVNNKCHRQDRVGTVIHEGAHNPSVVTPYCKDLGYGYNRATGLTSQRAKRNADNYALFAMARQLVFCLLHLFVALPFIYIFASF